MKLAGSEGDKAKITEADFRPVLVVQPVKVKTHLFQQQYYSTVQYSTVQYYLV